MQAALLLTCSQVAHVLITIEMAIWVQDGNGDEERIALSQEAQVMLRDTNIRDTLSTLLLLY